MKISFVIRAFILWLLFIFFSFFLVFLFNKENMTYSSFYNVGPSDNLIILGILINTREKYSCLVLFCSINSCFRTLSHNFLSSWLINNVQDNKARKEDLNKITVYSASIINVVYTWVDWLLYMNILLSQIDLFFCEVISDIIVTCICNSYYLQQKKYIAIDSEDHEI
jgi:hypothetical protein